MLIPALTGWPDQGLIIDVAVHVGTLFAVLIYFWRDVLAVLRGAWAVVRGRRQGDDANLVLCLIVATLPVIIAGFALKSLIPEGIRSVEVIAWATIVFGVLLWLADKRFSAKRRITHMGIADAAVIGLAQAFALIPGTSRSGVTMTAARMLGFERTEAARFSMLLSIPAIAGAGLLLGLDVAGAGNMALTRDVALAAGLAFVSALAAIWGLMAWLRRATFTPFVIYRIALGVALLLYAYGVFDTI